MLVVVTLVVVEVVVVEVCFRVLDEGLSQQSSITEVSVQSILQNLLFLTVLIMRDCFAGEGRERVGDMIKGVAPCV